ncbi:MAG: hypothetical protein ACI4UM_06170 [Succinivibrio sp.]
MIIVIATAVVLLLFIMISFILNSRRISRLEKENSALKSALEQSVKALNELSSKQSVLDDSFERRIKVCESSGEYLTSKLQDVLDRQRDINSSFDHINVKLEQQKKEFETKSVENQPIVLAKRLLSEGMSISDVVSKTSLPSYEVEMLAKVHNLSAKVPEPKRSVEDEVNAQREAFEQMAAIRQNSVQNNLPQSSAPHHIASMKARDAYGMGARTPLRRPK